MPYKCRGWLTGSLVLQGYRPFSLYFRRYLSPCIRNDRASAVYTVVSALCSSNKKKKRGACFSKAGYCCRPLQPVRIDSGGAVQRQIRGNFIKPRMRVISRVDIMAELSIPLCWKREGA
ncbi:hypothetical protein BCR43DRAFT_208315 [Syncephalastrum racemosum]|uniref:Uncharacterized protein n=1 Tax=Syncephalastrum racemosum TaxID=13706 RepID=A0A1X2HIA6_SYNRA|nr:hypothetical protein BCR43DRAFT_208315 [Syncephalastrum racemosum]